MIYLDYAATTPLAPEAWQAMQAWVGPDAPFANPASSHPRGLAARDAVEAARAQVAGALGAQAEEIIWTSGATEANNLALKGAVEFYASRGRHIVTSRIEHKSVLDTCRYLETRGAAVTYLEPDDQGRIGLDQVAAALREDTVLVSLMWVNNELGTITDIPAIAELTRSRGVLMHSDAAQAVGKLEIDLSSVPVDLLSVAAHKVYGPQGVGALFVRRRPRARLAPQMHGGGHQQGMRSGTLPAHQLVATGVALKLLAQRQAADQQRIAALRDRFEQGLQAIEGVVIHGAKAARAANYSNFHVDGVDGEALKATLTDVCVSSGSACSSATAEPSYVLRGLGLSDAQAGASLRVSCGRQTQWQDLERTLARLERGIWHLRSAASGELSKDSSPYAGIGALSIVGDYSASVRERFVYLEGFGRLSAPDHRLRVADRARSAWIEIDVGAAGEGQGRTALARAQGCPTTLAVASLLACVLSKLEPEANDSWNAARIQRELEIPPQRLHCALMGEDLLRAWRQSVSLSPVEFSERDD